MLSGNYTAGPWTRGQLRRGRVPRSGRPRASGSLAGPVRSDRQVAVLLIQEGVEALVVARRQVEQTDQRAIASARLLQSAIDKRRQFGARDFVRTERLLHDLPEVAAAHQPVPQVLRDVLAVGRGCRWL